MGLKSARWDSNRSVIPTDNASLAFQPDRLKPLAGCPAVWFKAVDELNLREFPITRN